MKKKSPFLPTAEEVERFKIKNSVPKSEPVGLCGKGGFCGLFFDALGIKINAITECRECIAEPSEGEVITNGAQKDELQFRGPGCLIIKAGITNGAQNNELQFRGPGCLIIKS